MKANKEQAAEWFETIHPPGPAAREMYRMAAQALRAQVVVDDSLAPRSAFPDVDGYIKYLIGVILNLETARGNLRALVAELEEAVRHRGGRCMNKDISAALLGDHEAAKRLTDAGVLLPCCGKPPILKFHFGIKAWTVECAVNGHIHNTGFCSAKEHAIDTWNTRAPILSAEEMEMLDERSV